MGTRYEEGDIVYQKFWGKGGKTVRPMKEEDGIRIVDKIENPESSSPDYIIKSANQTYRVSAAVIRKPDWDKISNKKKLEFVEGLTPFSWQADEDHFRLTWKNKSPESPRNYWVSVVEQTNGQYQVHLNWKGVSRNIERNNIDNEMDAISLAIEWMKENSVVRYSRDSTKGQIREGITR